MVNMPSRDFPCDPKVKICFKFQSLGAGATEKVSDVFLKRKRTDHANVFQVFWLPVLFTARSL